MGELTPLLQAAGAGDSCAAEQLMPLVYDELRKLAAARMAAERDDHSLHATALVHEAYVHLASGTNSAQFHGRAHFFSAASEAMRRILVDHARRRRRLKRGGGWKQVPLDQTLASVSLMPEELLACDEVLDRLSDIDALAAQILKLRVFVGLTMMESAAALEMPESTAKKKWLYARAWVRCEIAET
ncbi:MAG: ECF-type sigma factor [Fuerstiella sp.]